MVSYGEFISCEVKRGDTRAEDQMQSVFFGVCGNSGMIDIVHVDIEITQQYYVWCERG